MSTFKLVTLIGSHSLTGEEQNGTELLATLRRARADLFTEQSPVIDFHGDRYVVIHEGDERILVEAWAIEHKIKLHGAITSREDTYRLYIGWTGIIDTRLDHISK